MNLYLHKCVFYPSVDAIVLNMYICLTVHYLWHQSGQLDIWNLNMHSCYVNLRNSYHLWPWLNLSGCNFLSDIIRQAEIVRCTSHVRALDYMHELAEATFNEKSYILFKKIFWVYLKSSFGHNKRTNLVTDCGVVDAKKNDKWKLLPGPAGIWQGPSFGITRPILFLTLFWLLAWMISSRLQPYYHKPKWLGLSARQANFIQNIGEW